MRSRESSRRFRVFLIALVVMILDRCTKFVATSNILPGESVSVIPRVFHFTLVLNKGIAFGLLKGRLALFASFSYIVLVFIIGYVYKHRDIGPAVLLALGLIFGGAVGNLIDRSVFGHVIDFLDFRVWPVFNVADSSITIGAMILVWNFLAHGAKSKT